MLLLTVVVALREEKEIIDEEQMAPTPAPAAAPVPAPAATPAAATCHGSAIPKQHGEIIMVSPLPEAHEENTEKCVVLLKAKNGMQKGRLLGFFENSGNFILDISRNIIKRTIISLFI